MNTKLTSIEEGLKKIEAFDLQIRQYLEDQSYGEIVKIMPRRMAVISQMNLLKEKYGISVEDKKQLDEIFSGAQSLQKVILEKKNKISNRLKKHKTTIIQNKKLRY